MQVIPALDLRAGRTVRLRQGRFDEETRYDVDPRDQARRYREAGASWLHVVDLDGARTGSVRHLDLISDLVDVGMRVQAGGGVRAVETVQSFLDAGVSRVVVGSTAVREPERVASWIERFGGDRLVIALDVDVTGAQARVRTDGWETETEITFGEAVRPLRQAGARHLLCTDIGRDGMMSGPNVDLYRRLVEQEPTLAVQASGGVRDAADLQALEAVGAAAAIVGRAFLDGRLSLDEGSRLCPPVE